MKKLLLALTGLAFAFGTVTHGSHPKLKSRETVLDAQERFSKADDHHTLPSERKHHRW